MMIWKLFRRAADLRNRAILLCYLLDRISTQLWATRPSRRNWHLEINGDHITFRSGNGELALYHEICVDGVYELHPDFVPRAGWQVLDIGANIGMFTLRAARLAAGGRVVCVEPGPETYGRLVSNIQMNGLDNVTPVRAAVGATSGRGWLRQSGQSTTARLIDRFDGVAGRVSVDLLTLDDLVKRTGLQHVDLMKLDIEGGEVAALAVVQEMLGHCDRIVLEVHGTGAVVRRCLEQWGFQLVRERAPTHAFFINRRIENGAERAPVG